MIIFGAVVCGGALYISSGVPIILSTHCSLKKCKSNSLERLQNSLHLLFQKCLKLS